VVGLFRGELEGKFRSYSCPQDLYIIPRDFAGRYSYSTNQSVNPAGLDRKVLLSRTPGISERVIKIRAFPESQVSPGSGPMALLKAKMGVP